MAFAETLTDEDFLSIASMMLDDEFAVEDNDLKVADLHDCVLDSLPILDSVSSPSLSVDTTSATRTERSEVSFKASRYRNRKREELERLRNAVKTLEVRLAALQSRSLLPVEPEDPSPRIWESLAIHESDKRQAAERQNKELREVVELHYQLAQKLEDVLKKVSAHVNIPSTRHTTNS